MITCASLVLVFRFYQQVSLFAIFLFAVNALNGVCQIGYFVLPLPSISWLGRSFTYISSMLSICSAFATLLILSYLQPNSASQSWGTEKLASILFMDAPVCVYSLSYLLVISSHHLGLSQRAIKVISSTVLLNLVR